MAHHHKSHGFSLVELSIVLVILGLLVGGVLAGQSLIRAAELRVVTTEYTRYITASQSFRDKYFMLPGDISNAQSFWGSAAACPGTSAQPSTNATTCNGNGDGAIMYYAGSNELYRYWQHLANAGLVEGTYSGVTGGAANSYTSIVGTNVPRSKLNGAGWSAYNYGTQLISSTWAFEGVYENIFFLGSNYADYLSDTPVLKPEEAWNIDTKLDDGKPGTGLVRVRESLTSCHDAGTSNSAALAGTARYALATTTVSCDLIFKM